MLGRHHLLLSVGTVSVVLAPLFPYYPLEVIVGICGAAIGSLIPDADSPDAAIFHPQVRGIEGSRGEILNVLGFLYPVFGYVTKYLIYKPSVRFYDMVVFNRYDIGERHRGFLHSFLGIGTATILTGVYMVPVLFALELLSVIGIAVFLAAYFAGAILHLAEDSCTKTGIQWNYPFQSWAVKGQITTTARPEDTKYQGYFLGVLGGLIAVMFIVPLVVEQFAFYYFSLLGMAIAVLAWAVFGKFVARCELHT